MDVFRCITIALHLSGCGTSEFLSHQSLTSFRALFSLIVRASINSAVQKMVVSSAYRYVSPDSTADGRSFVNSENSVGPSTDPCGTP